MLKKSELAEFKKSKLRVIDKRCPSDDYQKLKPFRSGKNIKH